LYSKAIELTATDAPAQALLYGNRSMCELNMNRSLGAVKDAEEAIKLDPSYIKAYYRKAMGHFQTNQYKEAREALQRGLTLKPDDKELLAQLVKVEDKLRSESEKKASTPVVPAATSKVSVSHSPSSSSKPSKETSSTPSTSKPAATTTTSSGKTQEEDEEELNLNLRGYKKTADGRTTTFFNNEMDEQTKALIGNIAPKKLEVTGEVLTAAPSNGVGSVWNAAGTYEERILTPWATDALRTVFSSLKFTTLDPVIPGSVKTLHPDILSVIVEVTNVESVTGDAQVTMLRGKKKHVCDYTVVLKWNILVTYQEDTNAKDPIQLVGLITVQDITADGEYEVDHMQVTHQNDTATSYHSLPRPFQEIVNKFIKASDFGLQKEIKHALHGFWAELKTK